MTARNRPAFRRGLAVRAAVRVIMAAHPSLHEPLTAKRIIARLPAHLRRDEATIRWHMRAIRCAAEIEALATCAPREFIT